MEWSSAAVEYLANNLHAGETAKKIHSQRKKSQNPPTPDQDLGPEASPPLGERTGRCSRIPLS